jgi:hypothetical protein
LLAAENRTRIGRDAETPGPYIVRPCVSPKYGTKHENELRASVWKNDQHRKYGKPRKQTH